MTATYPERTIATLIFFGILSILGGISLVIQHSISLLIIGLILFAVGILAFRMAYKIRKSMYELDPAIKFSSSDSESRETESPGSSRLES